MNDHDLRTDASTTPATGHPPHAPDGDLAADLPRLLRRRGLLLAAGGGALAVLGCGGSAGGADSSTSSGGGLTGTDTGTGTGTGTGACPVVAEETSGPYPADGSNAANGQVADALRLSGIVRSDIRPSLAGATGVAQGVALALTLTLVDNQASCASLEGYAVYLWHCDREGRYSMYSPGVTAENYLRGVQVSDAGGRVTFTTIFPACYAGRMPHIHFEVYRSAATATTFGNALRTSQVALPTEVCATVYDTAPGYEESVANLSQISFATDNVFSDGVTTELATVTGSVAAGYVATLTVGLAL